MITVAFKDKDDNFYFGNNQSGHLTGFRLFLTHSESTRTQLREFASELELHQFMVIDIVDEPHANGHHYRLDPIVVGSLTSSDSEEELAVPLCDMGPEKLLETLNNLLPPKYLLPGSSKFATD